jgi:outer membrane receptor for ferrienterochelin and colicin
LLAAQSFALENTRPGAYNNMRLHDKKKPPARPRGAPLATRHLLFAGLMVPAAVAAQSMTGDIGNSDAESRQLETVNVNARRSIEQRFFATGSMVVVDRRDIEQLGAFSVADVLKQLPGVQVTTNANGGIEIRMRGMERNATQLLVDGQRVASGSSQLALDQQPSEMLERIEVVRAPSAEFAGATGGTINIVLRQATTQRETNIRLTDNRVWGRDAGQLFFSRTGPLGGAPAKAASPVKPATPVPAATPPGSASDSVPGFASAAEPPAADATGNTQALPTLPEAERPWSYFVAVSDIGMLLGSDVHRRTVTGDSVVAESDATGRFRRSDLSLVPRLNGRLGASDQLALRATLSRSRFAGRYESQGTGADASGPYVAGVSEAHHYKRHYYQGGADWTHRFANSKLETTLSASHAGDNVDRTGESAQDYAAGPDITTPYAFVESRTDSFQTFSSKLTGTSSALLWSTGVLVEHRSLDVDNTSSSGNAAPARLNIGVTTQRNALWGQNEWELPASTTLTAGLRYESLTIRSSDAGLLERRSTHYLQPSLHARTPIDENLQFRVNVARVTRNPGIWDLVDRSVPSQGSNSINNPDTVGNPNLRPEVAWTLDAGFERRLAPQGQVGFNLFVRQLRDTIASTVTFNGARWVEQRSNVGDATVWGLEADAKTGLTWAGLGRDWTLSANASLLQSRMTSGINEGNRIPGQARYLASVTIAKPLRRTGGFFGGGTLSMTGPSQQNSSPGITGHADSRTALDLYIGSVFPKLGYWRVGVFNIGNARFWRERNYVDASGSVVRNESGMTLTPRVYLTVGTQF